MFQEPPGCKALPDEAAGQPRLGQEPDLLFIAKANLRRLEEGLVRGPTDLVVGIVSPESEWRGRYDKFRGNAAGGVPEYW
ncbi:MAG TPA: Uma2 family endonuclease [Chloroflexia bacterium]|nr:Uma2 family endonuclease [Chloroflexia bacterium]